MDYPPTKPAFRVSLCRNSGSSPGARAPPNKCDAPHTTSLAPGKASDRKSCDANAHRCHRTFFLAAAQRQHAYERIAKDSVNGGRENKPGETISISKLTAAQ
jgi:hypothetical protein